MAISIDSERAFEKIQHPFMTKILNKVGIEETYFNITKAINEKPTANITLNGEKLKNFSSKFRIKTRIPTLTTFIQHSSGSPNQSIQTRKIRSIEMEMEEVKLSLFVNYMEFS